MGGLRRYLTPEVLGKSCCLKINSSGCKVWDAVISFRSWEPLGQGDAKSYRDTAARNRVDPAY